jgi:hypothetical protein
MRLVVLQSNYIPWKGYFDLMASADLFVVYDSVQYTKNDWRNRNRLPTATEPTWLTIPIMVAGRAGQSIRDAEISDGGRWAAKHWRTVEQALGRRPHFADYAAQWQDWYDQAGSLHYLHEVNGLFLRGLARQLGIATPIVEDRDYPRLTGDPTARLVQLCRLTGADRYLTGPAGLDYLDRAQFADAGVGLEVIDYAGYPVYPQRGPTFEHGVSVLDLLANVGPEAGSHLRRDVHPVE